jgi:hypothetical protein
MNTSLSNWLAQLTSLDAARACNPSLFLVLSNPAATGCKRDLTGFLELLVRVV